MDNESLCITSAVIGLVFGTVTAAIFHYKGRSRWAGFVLGWFLGPLGLIISLFLPSDQAELDQRKFERGELAQCPHCREFVKVDATICKYCHRSLPTRKVVRRSQSMTGTKRCPSCGALTSAKNTECGACGHPFK